MTIRGSTAVCAIIADPVSRARTPALMNETLRRIGVDAVLIPFQVKADQLSAVVPGRRAIDNLVGAVISMPHKQSIVSLLDRITPTSKTVGAVNVVRREPDGRR